MTDHECARPKGPNMITALYTFTAQTYNADGDTYRDTYTSPLDAYVEAWTATQSSVEVKKVTAEGEVSTFTVSADGTVSADAPDEIANWSRRGVAVAMLAQEARRAAKA
jgi:hypothetical protein